MKKIFLFLLLAAVSFGGWVFVNAADDAAPKPLRVLLVAGGCCHDYEVQKDLLKAGIEARINAVVDIEYNADKSTKTTFPIFEKANWAEGYDVVVHDECSAAVTDPAYVKRVIDAHKNGVPAVNLHCAMHCYRWGNFKELVKLGDDNAGWYEMLGLQSTGHGPRSPIEIVYTDKEHPTTKGLTGWTTLDEELYNNIQIFDSAHALSIGRQTQMPRKKKNKPADPNAKPKEVEAVVTWTNEFGPKKTRIFSTTLGHCNETVGDDRYLDLVARGVLWAAGQLNDDGTAACGFEKKCGTCKK